MAYLQGKGVVHMDLATRNVLLTHPDELAKVSDFGLSRFIYDVEERWDGRQMKNTLEGSYIWRSQKFRIFWPPPPMSRTGQMGWMAHRKWKEIMQQPGTAGSGNMLGCCLLSFHFLWAIHPIRHVHNSFNLIPFVCFFFTHCGRHIWKPPFVT